MTTTSTEKAAYGRGYNAGRKRAIRDFEAERRAALKEEFQRQVFLAILPQLVSEPWQTGGKIWSSPEEFVAGARLFARIAAEEFIFPLPPADPREAVEGFVA